MGRGSRSWHREGLLTNKGAFFQLGCVQLCSRLLLGPASMSRWSWAPLRGVPIGGLRVLGVSRLSWILRGVPPSTCKSVAKQSPTQPIPRVLGVTPLGNTPSLIIYATLGIVNKNSFHIGLGSYLAIGNLLKIINPAS